MRSNLFATAIYLLLIFCTVTTTSNATGQSVNDRQVRAMSQKLTAAEKNNDIENFLSCYDENAISMPEYQATLTGIGEIGAYYKEIFLRQKVKAFQRTAEEVIALGNTLIEIGTFKKQYTDPKTGDSVLILHGKYYNVWGVQPGGLKLKGEAYGYFNPVADPARLVVTPGKVQPATTFSIDKEVSFELKAYNALIEKGVRTRDGLLRAETFTDDARVMPFADSTRAGMEKIKPYMIAYNSGKVSIDSITVATYHSEYLGDAVLEYTKFSVQFTTPQNSGKMSGKGVRIWKRQADHSLKLFREIGTHNYVTP